MATSSPTRNRIRRPSVLPVWSPFLSIGYLREFLRQVGVAFDRHGLPYDIADDVATVTVAGRPARIDLRQVASVVAGRPLRDWPERLGGEVDRLVGIERAALDVPLAPLDEVRGTLLPRIVTADTGSAIRRRLADGLGAELVYDRPTGLAVVPEAHVEHWDMSVDDLWPDVVENTRARVRPLIERHRETQRRYDVVGSASPLTASVVCCLEELIGPIAPYGALVGIPSRHELVAYVITDAAGTDEAFADLAGSVRRRAARAPGALTPALYWWRAGDLVPVTPVEPDPDVETPSPPVELAEVVAGLPGAEPGGDWLPGDRAGT